MDLVILGNVILEKLFCADIERFRSQSKRVNVVHNTDIAQKNDVVLFD